MEQKYAIGVGGWAKARKRKGCKKNGYIKTVGQIQSRKMREHRIMLFVMSANGRI